MVMITLVDDFLNKITMYRLLLYVLIILLIAAGIFSSFNFLPFTPLSLLFSVSILVAGCWISNKLLAKLFSAPTNLESVYITALILSLIITPIQTAVEIPWLVLAAVISQASKYILAVRRQHLFNPAALAVFLTGLSVKSYASWWVGNPFMFVLVVVGGLLVVRKLRRFSLVLTFFGSFLISILGSTFNPAVLKTLIASPIFFFAFIMLTEPQTTPFKRGLQIIYGGLVGVLTFFLTPELALLIGNVFSYLSCPREKLLMNLIEKNQIANQTYEFIFKADRKLNYLAGQYMEWTLPHLNPDSRGVRRYFTLASSPSEEFLKIGIKFYPNASSFKRKLVDFKIGEGISAGQLSGEFTLPNPLSVKVCFIAGGIGITPFRSMVKYMLEKAEKRDIVLLYSNKTEADICYRDIFDSAKDLGVKIVYVVTDKVGFIDEPMIKRQVPDFKDRIFYISGPHSMVDAFEKTLKGLGVKNIKVDFFPGYA